MAFSARLIARDRCRCGGGPRGCARRRGRGRRAATSPARPPRRAAPSGPRPARPSRRSSAGERGLAVAGDAGEPGDPPAARARGRRARSPGRRRPVETPASVEQRRPGRHRRAPPAARSRRRPSAAPARAGRSRAVAPLADEAAVAQHQHAVGDRHHLAELVADEDDRRAPRPPRAAACGTAPRSPAASAPRSARRGSGCARRGRAP